MVSRQPPPRQPTTPDNQQHGQPTTLTMTNNRSILHLTTNNSHHQHQTTTTSSLRDLKMYKPSTSLEIHLANTIQCFDAPNQSFAKMFKHFLSSFCGHMQRPRGTDCVFFSSSPPSQFFPLISFYFVPTGHGGMIFLLCSSLRWNSFPRSFFSFHFVAICRGHRGPIVIFASLKMNNFDQGWWGEGRHLLWK